MAGKELNIAEFNQFKKILLSLEENKDGIDKNFHDKREQELKTLKENLKTVDAQERRNLVAQFKNTRKTKDKTFCNLILTYLNEVTRTATEIEDLIVLNYFLKHYSHKITNGLGSIKTIIVDREDAQRLNDIETAFNNLKASAKSKEGQFKTSYLSVIDNHTQEIKKYHFDSNISVKKPKETSPPRRKLNSVVLFVLIFFLPVVLTFLILFPYPTIGVIALLYFISKKKNKRLINLYKTTTSKSKKESWATTSVNSLKDFHNFRGLPIGVTMQKIIINHPTFLEMMIRVVNQDNHFKNVQTLK